MRVAIISDLHANLAATEAVSEDIAHQSIQETWCLGDIVGYGGSPREVLDWAEKHASIIVKGNHDHAVATGDVEGFNPVAAAAARNHAQVLAPPARTRLDDLPLDATKDVAWGERGVAGTALLVHASPDDPLHEYVYPTAARRDLDRWRGIADIILLGHTHVPFVAMIGKGPTPPWRADGFEQTILVEEEAGAGAAAAAPAREPLMILNPGSVGQPRDGDSRAAYAILDTRERRVELRRVSYDIDAAANAIRAARLDPFLAQRLFRGI